jgi:hypothetical protein
MGSVRLGLGGAVDRFKKVLCWFAVRHAHAAVWARAQCEAWLADVATLNISCPSLNISCPSSITALQVMEEPQRRKVFYMTMGVVAVMFVLYLVLKRR